tara:strand:+ start:91 stop:696 length:606 start_codon:yes stop_codon:yes gene_type:complete
MYNLQPQNKIVSYKIVILGQTSVGKSSIVTRFIHDRFDEFQESTIGAAFFSKTIEKDDCSIKFDIWDTAGQERYRSLAPMYYRGARYAIVVMDITQADSLVSAKYWIEELQTNSDHRCNVMLVGNKLDRESDRNISTENATEFAREYDIDYIEVSAKTGVNIDNIFDNISNHLIEEQAEEEYNENNVNISKKMQFKKNKCC